MSIQLKPIPNSWLARWQDATSRTLYIEKGHKGEYLVTVFDKGGKTFRLNTLIPGLKRSKNMPAELCIDKENQPFFQVEAGTPGGGPTLNLYFAYCKGGEVERLARETDQVEHVVILPEVGMGLYDDWEDDLGVPWVFPLSMYKKTS